MPIITREEVKAFLDISTSEQDTKIDLLIPEVEAFVKTWCNDPMTEEYPEGIKRPVSELLRFDLFYRNKGTGTNSETLGDYSIVYDFRNEAGYPEKVLHLLKPWKKMKQVKFI